jgi:hypothetical protein
MNAAFALELGTTFPLSSYRDLIVSRSFCNTPVQRHPVHFNERRDYITVISSSQVLLLEGEVFPHDLRE